jgi:hypothetical protein
MSIPFIYKPRVQDNHQIVDGGVTENYPFWVHLVNATAEDMRRTKIGFYLDSGDGSAESWGCPNSPHRALNLAEEAADDFVSNLLPSSAAGNPPPVYRGDLVEVKMLSRLAAVEYTRGEKTALHDALWARYADSPDVRLFEARIPLGGFFWLDFDVDAPTYAGLGCRGFQAALRVIQDRRIVDTVTTDNPYRASGSMPRLVPDPGPRLPPGP